ncbi:putative membrane protein [Marmoricola sp. OAE513]|uniref:DoxX family protein n=1 Tax=Marmoricola sp. OAE513 TaxID=2817894 RepID=UPI001AE3DA03
MTAPLRRDAKLLATGFLASGTVHLVKPDVWEPLMPDWVPAHREVIIWSGVAEIACAAGLLFPPTRKVAGLASAALLAGVYVGNVKMAVDASKSKSLPLKAAAYGRLPLQFPMIRAALRAGRS